MPVSYTIQEGDTTTRLGFRFGLFPDTIWNYPANEELKRLRVDMDILMPGDVLTIPDKQTKQLPAATDQSHSFKVKGVPAVFRLQVFDDEQPRANQNYVLLVDGKTFNGTADSNGVLEAHISPDAVRGQLTIGPDNFRLDVAFGTLDPLREVAGIQKRLKNLGFYSGAPSGVMDGVTKDALAGFQRRFGLTETGEADDATLAKLQQQNDAVSAYPEEPAQ